MNQPTEHTIKAQDFRTWLLRQPDERTWDYNSVNRCTVCCFLAETQACGSPCVLPNKYSTDIEQDWIYLPDWLIGALAKARDYDLIITARNLKTALNL